MHMLAQSVLAHAATRQTAYNAIQLMLMQRFIARGGTPEEWARGRSSAFRRRYGWVLESATPCGDATSANVPLERCRRRLP